MRFLLCCLILLTMNCGCQAEKDHNQFVPDLIKKDDLDKSIQKGLAWTVRQPADFTDNAGTLWVLHKINKTIENKDVDALWQRTLNYNYNHGTIRSYLPLYGLTSELKSRPPRLSASPSGQPLFLLDWMIGAANCEAFKPGPELMKELLEKKYEGYILTHQFLALQWMLERNCYNRNLLEDKIAEVVSRMVREQSDDKGFSDLIAERVAFILYAGRFEDVNPSWIVSILQAQQEDGRWEQSPHTKTKINNVKVSIGTPHTTAFALWTLMQYRDHLFP